jgi:geranylgeranyl pyrophosphate synthase
MRVREGELSIALELVDRRMHEIVEGSDRMVLTYMAEVSKGRGKRLRPRLMISAAEMFGGASLHSVANCAACCELLHTATLIHDDVIDEAPTRRGNLTLNSLFGNEIAVVVGDYLLALVFKAINREKDFLLIDQLLSTSQELGMGVIEEVLNRNNMRLAPEKYFSVIYLKTASLFALCCSMGAYLGGASEECQRLARDYGKHLGLAFQVVDDLLDLTQDSSATGKPAMNDIKEGRITLPVIHALNMDSETLRPLIEQYQESHSAESERALKQHLADCGSLDYALNEAQRLLESARMQARSLAREGAAPEALGALSSIEQLVLDTVVPASGKFAAG